MSLTLSLFLATFTIYLIIVGSAISLSSHYEKKQERKEIERKKQRALETIVHEDISADSDEEKKNMKKRILEYCDRDEVTPELISYFKDNYLSVLEKETRKIAKQKALEEQQEQELTRNLQDLEKSKKAQLDAFKTVKGLSK